MSDKNFKYTIEDFEFWYGATYSGDILKQFKEAVEASKPKDNEVWLVDLDGETEYARFEKGIWWSSMGEQIKCVDSTPIKKIGVDE